MLQVENTNMNQKSAMDDVRLKFLGLTGARIIYEKLVENNINLVCGISGGNNLNLIDAFHPDHHNNNASPIQFITNSNESNGGHVVAGYAKVTGKPGVICVTSGPGVTNLITPLQDALSDGVPMLALTGQVRTTAPPDAFQSVDTISLTKTCTKWNIQLKSVSDIPFILDYALHVATTSRPGPVLIDCPKDIQTEVFTKNHLEQKTFNINSTTYQLNFEGSFDFDVLDPKPTLDSFQLNSIVNLINQAKRPVLYVGQGANGSKNELLEFVNKTNIPVTTTVHAMGILDERHPLALQMVGMHGHAAPNFMIQRADLIIALGSRFDDRTVGALEYYAPEAREAQKHKVGGFIHVDIRPTEKNRIINVNEFVNSDCRVFLQKLNKEDLKLKERSEWLEIMRHYKQQYPIFIPTFQDGKLSCQKVILELDKQIEDFRERCVFTTGVGCHQMITAQLITWSTPRSMITSGSLGTMGVALGFAIGAKLADPDKMVIAVDGDGSFNMTNTELKTIMDLQLPVKIVIMNNGGEMMAVFWQKLFLSNRYISTLFQNCDYNKLAEAYGIYNIHCDNERDLSEMVNKFLKCEGPVLFNVVIEKTPCLPMVSPGKALDNMMFNDFENNNFERDEVPG